MKQFLILILLGGILASCETSQTISVQGTPGTEIYTPNKKLITTVPPTGTAKIKISSDIYYAFLLSRNAGAADYIPFALDYKTHNYTLAKVGKYAGLTVAFGGVMVTAIGLGVLIAGGEDMESVSSPMLVAGGLASLAGIGIGWPSDNHTHQTQYKYRYKYLSTQQTNQDLVFRHPQLAFAAPAAIAEPASSRARRNVKPATNPQSDKATRTIRDNATKVAGTYSGTGQLLQKLEEVESYEGIRIIVTRINRNTVSVEVIDGQGESFFAEPGTYTVVPNKKGGYVLKHKSIPSALITIGRDRSAKYVHPRVNIDGHIYKLEIKATLN